MNPRPDTAPPSPADVFRLAFLNSPAMQTVSRVADRKVIEVNDAFLNTLGYKRDEVLGREAPEMEFWVHPEKSQPFRDELVAKGKVRGFEIEIYTKTREIRTILLSADLVALNGEPHVLAAGVDITARKQAEEQLRQVHGKLQQSEERFSKAFRLNPSLVAMTRMADGRFVMVNEAFARASGYTEEEILGRTSLELGLHATAQQREAFLKAAAEGTLRNFEMHVRAGDGSMQTILSSGECIEVNGEPHLLTVGVDITARKRAEARLQESEVRLRESEARFATAFRASPVLMTIGTLHDGRFIEVNDAFINLLGLTREETIGRNTLELGLWVDPTARQRLYEQASGTGGAHNLECQIRDRRGIVHTMLLSAEKVEINRVPHILTFAVDVTRRKEAEVEQARALEREKELHQLKSDFVALVSHEFRTPLEIIMSSADNLDRYFDRLKPEQRRQLLGTINKSVRRMTNMMEDVLLLGRLDGGGDTEFKPGPLDVAALCRRLGEEMETATQRRCPIACRAAGDLAGAQGDETVLRHILTNLLSNAVKYSAAGEPVALDLRREGASAIFEISDRGCGIPAADQARLFQAFHRGSNVRQVPGTGLGLLIVQRSVDRHGGSVSCASAEGRGTTFTVRLPLFPAP